MRIDEYYRMHSTDWRPCVTVGTMRAAHSLQPPRLFHVSLLLPGQSASLSRVLLPQLLEPLQQDPNAVAREVPADETCS